MSGSRAQRSGQVPLERLIRVACTPEPVEPVQAPRRVGVSPAAAMALGALLVLLALALAARTALGTPTGPPEQAAAAQTTSSSDAVTTPQAGTGEAGTAQADGAGEGATGQEGGSGEGASPGSALAPVDPAAPASAQAVGQVVVHVAGAVAAPGVVVLPAGARVVDALDAAGGASADADTDLLNLARPVVDGEQVRVPRVGEDTSAWGGDGGAGTAGPGAAASGADQAAGTEQGGVDGALVNLNTADATQLETLPGIGPALAQRILTYRQEHGGFTSVDELTNVSGIGRARLEALRDLVTV